MKHLLAAYFFKLIYWITYPFAKLYDANNKLLVKIRKFNRGE